MEIGIQYLGLAGNVDVLGGDILDTFGLEGDDDRFVAIQADAELLQVEENSDDVFLHTVNGRKLVFYTPDLDLGHGRARQGREDDAAERIAQSMAVAGIETVD